MRRLGSYKSRRMVTAAIVALTLVGCDGSDPNANAVAEAPPPPPPPEPVRVGTLLQTSGADPRVSFPQEKAPTDVRIARAVIRLADAIASGDASALRPLLTEDAATVLDRLESTGAWEDATADLDQVRVVELSSEQVTLAVQKTGYAYPLRWMIRTEGGSVQFTGGPVEDVVLQRASQFDYGVPEPSEASTAMPVVEPEIEETAATGETSAGSDEVPPLNDPSIIRTPAGAIPNPLHNRPGGG